MHGPKRVPNVSLTKIIFYIEPIQDSDMLKLFNNQQIRELVAERRKNRTIPEDDKGFMVFDI